MGQLVNRGREATAVPASVGDGRAPLRFISAASLFDGHDAAINVIRRLLQAHGAEVVHLGHNRSVADLVGAAIQEDADGIAISSYQGGHNEYFRYLLAELRTQNAGHIRVVVGGGGTIAPEEIAALEAAGIEKIYTPEDGQRLGLDGMIEDVMRSHRPIRQRCRTTTSLRERQRAAHWPRGSATSVPGPQPGHRYRYHRYRRRRQVIADRRTPRASCVASRTAAS